MNKDIRDGLVIGVAFAGLVSLFPAQANAQMDVKELCEAAVGYSVKYLAEESAFELHQARWKIMKGENTNDQEKMVGLVMFEIGQRIAYSANSDIEDPNKWLAEKIDQMHTSCEKHAKEQYADDLSDMESEGNIW